MNFSDERNFSRWFIIISSLIIVCLILWNTSLFFERLKQDERSKMHIWGSAFSELLKEKPESDITLITTILEENTTTPMIVYTIKEDVYATRNIPNEDNYSQQDLQEMAADFAGEYDPIDINVKSELISIVYYGNSPLITKLKYYPVGLLLIVVLFIGVIYFFYTTSKSSEQNKLWAGMAKETAHQIGTPLSSLVGWTEILSQENVNEEYLKEIKKDVDRLEMITERFSKIGSAPTLEKADIVEETKNSYDYLKLRSSKLIEFSLELPTNSIPVNLNKQLYSWTIENLVKNAIDAMRGKGKLLIQLKEEPKWVCILISDTGKGIPKSKFHKIFEPGFTTKKRGWGLGLSLTKRIIEDYHEGKIRVFKSELEKGTTFQIRLRKK
ncbi:MAG TPA: HAMP domain-containing sensor histidine kinase [Salinimicrobium sp.]|nr:HAMP domain-containing sensor histidine kinase [Salinimicrobium sp.]